MSQSAIRLETLSCSFPVDVEAKPSTIFSRTFRYSCSLLMVRRRCPYRKSERAFPTRGSRKWQKLGVKSGEGFYDYSESKKAEKVSKQFN